MVKMLEQMSEQVDSQLLSLEWSRFSENVVIVVLSKKQVLQTGVHCSFRGSKESMNHGFTSTSFHCSSHASEINTPIYVNIPALMAAKSPKPVDPAQTTEWPKENSTYSSNDISNETFVSNDTTYHFSSSDTSSLPQELPVFPYSPNSYPLEAQANRPREDDDSATSTSAFPTFSSSTSPWDALNISSKYFSKLSKPLNLSSHLNISAKHLFPYANISPINTIHSQHKTNVFVILHRTSKLFPVLQSDLHDPAFRKGNWAVVTPVLAVSIGGPAKNLSKPVVITFEVVDTRKPLKAAYFDFDLNEGNGGWKTDRCEIIKRNGTSIVVHVYHLSNFALLQDRSFQYRLAAFAMEPVLYVGSGVCMFCMLLVMITLMACFGSIGIPKKIKHAVVNLCLSTFLMMAAFIFGINRTDFELPCQMAGICIHYLTLCAVFWITIMSNIIYKKFIKANRPPEPPPELGPMPLPPKPILQFYFVGYGVPVIICGITAAVNINFYSGLKYCFLEWEPSLGAFYAPVALLVAWNLVLFMRISCVVRSVPETDSEAANESDNEIHTNEIELVPSQPDTTTNTTHNINLHHSNNNNNISSSNGGGYRRRYSRASNDEDEEDVVSVASIPDQERRPITQLRSLVAFLFLFIVMWMCGALAIAKPFRLIIPHQEIIFSYAYGLMSSFFGIFMVIYFICTRRDAQLSWKHASGCAPKETYTAPMEITELQPEPTPVTQPQANGSAVKSNSNTNLSLYSQKSSNITKAYNMKNNSKQSNINLIIPNSSEISFNSAQEGFPNFYNPRQNGAAKKFWQKNRHHSKVMNKDVNRDLNSSLTDNNSAGELNHHRHSHGTSSDANTHLSIEIQIQSKEKPSAKAGSFSSSREIPVHINNQITPQNMLGSSCGAISLEHNSQVSGIKSTTPDRDTNFASAYQQANPNQNLPQHQRSPSAGSLGTGVHPSAFTPVQPRNNNTLPRHGKNLDEGDEKLRLADKDGSVPRNQLSGTNSQTERSLQGEAPLRPVNPGVAWNPYCNLSPLTSHTATYSFTPPPPAHSQQQHYPFDYGVFPQPVSLNPQIFNLNQSHPSGPNGLSPTPLNQQVLPSFNIPPSPYLIQSQGRQVKSMSPGSSSSHSQSQTNRKNRCSGNSWRPLSGGDSSDSSRPRPKRTQAGGSPGRTVTYAPCSPVMSDSQAYEPHYQGPNQNTQQNMKKARSIDSDHHSDPTHRKKHHRSERHSRNKLTNKQRSLGWDEQFKGRPSKANYVYVNHMYRDKVMHKLIKQASESDDLATKAFWLPRSASEYERLTQKGFCNMADDSSTSSDDGDSLDDNVWIRQSSGSDFQKKETSV
ncbi:unnamed protein product [Lymnaea stagnalis]|uniref:G-protein coupled receptors family 2 profile 2 domain-containing protein n=1 Tax=Lymnaea stagnalis TaxID=6523 RepID=A0AAV2IQM7_LYMST